VSIEPRAQPRLFENHRYAEFLERPNRFVIRARDPETGEVLTCHCPNPGSLAELALPGTPLILERRRTPGATAWTAAAARYRGGIVPLYSARANGVARDLVLPRLFPEASGVRPEFRIGGSRFDFTFVDPEGGRHLAEVKSCSLVERGVAMFPDAPSARALRHLEELAALSREGWTCHVLFLIQHGHPRTFIPNLHTDPAFAAALGSLAPRLDLRAVSLETSEDGGARIVSDRIPIDLGHTDLAASDRGSYLVVLELADPAEIETGSLGRIAFPAGWYVYAGSARTGLSARVARHLRRSGKRLRWHIDYLTLRARSLRGLALASYENLECELAAALARIGGERIPGFGSSDCRCPGHLLRFASDPMKDRAFLDVLFRFRHELALERPS
jgi:sugar fermentation stimulation protein A